MTAQTVEQEPVSESNAGFAQRVGCNHTMASRLRSGHRMPSTDMLIRICGAYGLDKVEALDRYAAGSESFSAWLRDKIFGNRDEDSE